MAIQLSTDSVRQLVEQIPALDGASWAIDVLGRGSSNQCYRLRGSNDDLVLRINGEGSIGVDRQRELAVHQQAALRGMAPLVVAADPDRYLLLEYLAEDPWRPADASDPDRLRALGKYLRNLHEIPLTEIERFPRFDLAGLLAQYWAKPKLAEDRDLARIKGAASNLLGALNHSGWFSQRASLCHHDPMFSNLFGSEVLVMIDWEFSAIGNALLDLGFFVSYHDLPHDLATPLYESYFGICSKVELHRMADAIRVAQVLELVWLMNQMQLTASQQRRFGQLRLIWS